MATPTLEAALVAFARQRSARITEAILELGRAAAAGVAPPAERTNMGYHRAWLALAADVRNRSWCLDTATTRLPKLSRGKETPFGDKHEALLERLALFEEVPPDPRVMRAMVALFELAPPVIGWVPVHEVMARLIERHADDATRDAVGPGSPQDLAELNYPEPVELTTAEAACWTITAPAPKHDHAALWQAVYDAPGDDAARIVLADALQEHGDPRGELITLQLREAAGAADAVAIARAEELVKQHAKAWLGPLRPAIYRAWLRRGFLHRIELAGAYSSRSWDDHLVDPQLATVEELDPGQTNTVTYAKFIASPMLRSLRAVSVYSDDTLAAVKTIAAKLVRLEAIGWKRKLYERRFAEEIVPLLERTPTITELACTHVAVPLLPKSVVKRLVRLRCHGELGDGIKLWKQLAHLERLTIGWSDAVELVRGDPPYARLHATRFFKSSMPELATLPAKLKRLEVLDNAALARRLEAHHGKRFAVVAVPAASGAITGIKE